MATAHDASLRRLRNEFVIKSLYGDMPRQCTACGCRFKTQDKQRDHMDWHVRKNRALSRSRGWCSSADLWLVAAQESKESRVPKSRLSQDDQEVQVKKEEDTAVLADVRQKICWLCREPFEEFFSHETDDWMYKGTVFLRGNCGRIVHAKCNA